MDRKKLDRAIETTNFNVSKNKEEKEGFDEAAFDKSNKKFNAFNMGFSNNWRNLLKEDIRVKIEGEFL